MGIDVTRMFMRPSSLAQCSVRSVVLSRRPAISVVPGVGVDVIVLAFAVSVIGGLGSVAGAAIGALIVGLARACRRPSPARGRVIRHLRGDGHCPHIPAARPVRPAAPRRSDMTPIHHSSPCLALTFSSRRAADARVAGVPADHWLAKGLVALGLRRDDAGWSRVVRTGPLLRPGRLRSGTRH